MKKWFLIFLFLTGTFFVFAQKQGNIWYFGNRAGLDFNQLPPRAVNDSKLYISEGCAAIADNDGKLLFYTDGSRVINRLHLQMKNGDNLKGHHSSTNNALIIPLPGNDSIYYIFTVSAANEPLQQFQYNIVNIKGDGGFGEVLPAGMNIKIEDKIFEKISAIKHCNNKDVWIVVRKWNSDEYHSYLFTASGLNMAPVISNTGFTVGGDELNGLGTLKFSADGKKMVAAHSFENDAVEIMDFDNKTGIFSNPIVIHPNVTLKILGAYGAEFSADSRLLYVTSTEYIGVSAISVLYQFDITSNNPVAIMASRNIIRQGSSFGALQIGPDQKIYMVVINDTSVSVINDPNTYGPGCNFVFRQIRLAGTGICQFGLPTFVQSFFDTTNNPYNFSRLGNCTDLNVTFKINRLSRIDSVKWDFGDSHTSQALSPTNYYAAPGFYNVKLIVYKVDCSGLNDTINHKIWIAATPDFLGPDTAICSPGVIKLGIDNMPESHYLWIGGSTENEIEIIAPGTYWMEITNNGCKLRDSVDVLSKNAPVIDAGPDTTVCAFNPTILNVQSNGANAYRWNTGETTRSIPVSRTGLYFVTVTQSGCFVTDSVLVTPGDCEVFVPNTFTPNGDGKNETFGVGTEVAYQSYTMHIFNKWGEIIFATRNMARKWNGTYGGKDAPVGTYVWRISYINRKGQRKYEQGNVLLIR